MRDGFLRMANNHGNYLAPAPRRFALESCVETEMEDSFTTLISSQRDCKSSEAGGIIVPDDLTNLNWVAGIPVPMNTSVSPPDGSRVKRLYFGSPSKDLLLCEASSPTTPTYVVPPRTKSLKTPLPTYKIVVKDQTHDESPEKRDSVILANIVSSGNGYHEIPDLERPGATIITIDDDDCCVDFDKQVECVQTEISTEDTLQHDKPNCSYTCLIGMALKASNGCLPVNAIYQYIEREFPYFTTAPDGWKNSVRHNLSLNPIFRKVNREGWTGKKGYLWEVCPDKQDLVDKEILRFLHSTGKKLGEFTPPMKVPSKYKQRAKKLNHSSLVPTAPIFCSRCTRIVSPTPQESSTSSDDSYAHFANTEEVKKYSAEIQEEISSSDIQVMAGATATRSAFDMDEVPTKYIGVKSPTQDPKEVAKEMFGLCPSGSEAPNTFYSPINYGGPFIPFYVPPNQFGIPYDNNFDHQVINNSSSNSSEVSPVGSMATTLFPHYQQYAMPMPFPYILGGQYPQVYSCSPSATDPHSKDNTAQKLIAAPSPLSVRILSSSDQVEKPNGTESESQDVCQRKNLKTKHYSSGNFSYNCPDVAGLSSPLKRMKVIDGISMDKSLADDSISAYFADVSANSTCSDDETEDNEEVSSIMSLLQGRQNKEMGFSGLNQISFKEKETLEKIAGTSDLGLLLSNGLESMATKEGKMAQRSCSGVQSPPPRPTTCAETKYVFSANGDCVSMTAMDMHDIDAKVTSSQEDTYYLPSLDSLLNIGEDTIVTMKAAMNLDIQGVVEIATEDSCKDLQSQEAHSCTNGGLN